MKQREGLYHRIFEYENLCLAFWKAANGKQDCREVIRFRMDLDDCLLDLQKQLQQGCFNIGHYRFFRVYDPKPRNICAAAFPERVLHHAVMNICEPFLDRYLIFDSYACRVGKGNRKAVERARFFSERYSWYLKLDIRKYFDSIDHGILMELLKNQFKDRDLITLFEQILSTYHTRPGFGMPIGNLISQHFANFYLGLFDHWVKETKKIKGYVRYMDDMLFFGNSQSLLKKTLASIQDFLETRLALILKPNIQLNRTKIGIPFLGYRVFPWGVKLTAVSCERFVEKFRRYEQNRLSDIWTEDDLIRHMEPLIDFTRGADSLGFRRGIINRFGVLS